MIASRGFGRFLLHPSLERHPETGPVSRTALVFWLLVFSFAATAIFALLAVPLIVSSNAAPGESLRAVFGQSAISAIVTVVILGPLVEEMMFRGWLSGTPRALGGSAAFLAIVFGGSWLLRYYAPAASGLGAQAALAAVGYLVFFAIGRKDAGVPCAGFRCAFPLAFWLQGLAFGALHFANISSASILLPLLMTAPLMICGWLWGYARVALGFEAAWLLHMAYNVPAALATMALIGRAAL